MSRLRASGGALLGVAAVAALVSAFGAGSVAFLDQQGTAGIRSELAARAGADLALQVSFGPAANAERQDAEVRAAIANSLSASGVRFDVTRTVGGDIRVEPESQPESDSHIVESALATSIPDLADRADLDAGAFAERETEVAVQADAARDLGLSTGDTVLLDGARFTVSGTWHPKDPLDPRWNGDSIVARGLTDQYGPFAITETAWSRLRAIPTISWTVVPVDLRDFTSANLTTVIRPWASIQSDWRGEVSEMQSFGFKRGLSQTLGELDTRLDGQRAIEPVIFALLAALALITLSEVIGLVVSQRARESFLYWSRGSSPARIAVRAAADTGVAALLGAAAGCGLVVALAPALGLGDVVGSPDARLAAAPLAVVAGAVVLAVVRSLRSTRAATSTTRGGRSGGRARRVAVPGVVVLAVIGAGISVWQLRLYGSPVTPASSGRGAVDPLAVGAPAAALVALVLLVAAALPVLAKAGERLIRGGRVPVRLAARALALHSARFTAALVVVALAVGGTAVAAAYASTWSASYDAAAEFRAGADLHVNSRDEGIPAEAQSAVRGALGAGSVAPLDSQPLWIGSVSGSILAVSPDALSSLAATAGGLFDPETAASGIRVDPAGPTVPAGASELRITLAASGLDEAPTVSAHVVDPMGFVSVVEFGPPVDGDGGPVYSGDLADPGPLTVLAVDVHFAPASFTRESARVRLLGISAQTGGSDSPLELGGFWLPGGPGVAGMPPTGDGTGHGLSVMADTPWARLVPSLDGGEADRVELPVILSQHLATLLGIGVGDTVSFTLQEGAGRLRSTVSGVVPAIPGAATEAAVLMDLAVVQHFQLRAVEVPGAPRDLWISTASPGETKDAIRPLLPANTRFEAIDDPAARQVLGSPRIVFWAAAGCFVLLALVAVGSSLRARARWGSSDVATLRALGLSTRDQRAIPVAEFSVVLVLGLLWGALSGAVVAVLTVPQIVRAAVPQRYVAIGTSISWDVVGLGALIAGLVVVLTVLLSALAVTVSRLATTAKPGVPE